MKKLRLREAPSQTRGHTASRSLSLGPGPHWPPLPQPHPQRQTWKSPPPPCPSQPWSGVHEATLSSFGQDASCHFTPWEGWFSDTKLSFRGARFCWAHETAPQKQRCMLLGVFMTSHLSLWGSPLPSRAAGLDEVGGGGLRVRSGPPGVTDSSSPPLCVLQGGDSVHQASRLSPEAMSTSEGQEEGIEGEQPCRPALGLAPRNPGGPLSPPRQK